MTDWHPGGSARAPWPWGSERTSPRCEVEWSFGFTEVTSFTRPYWLVVARYREV